MNGVGGRVRDPQNCGVCDTVRGVRPPVIGSDWDAAFQFYTAPAVHGPGRCVDYCSSGSSVMLRSRNDNILPRFVQTMFVMPSEHAHRLLQSSSSFARRYVDSTQP